MQSQFEFNQPFRVHSDAVFHMNFIHWIRFDSCEVRRLNRASVYFHEGILPQNLFRKIRFVKRFFGFNFSSLPVSTYKRQLEFWGALILDRNYIGTRNLVHLWLTWNQGGCTHRCQAFVSALYPVYQVDHQWFKSPANVTSHFFNFNWLGVLNKGEQIAII